MRKTAWLAAALCVGFAPVAHGASPGGVYIHSDSLATLADSVDTAVQGANTLKPYDDQLANLADFNAKEDLAVATLAVARRNAELQYLIGLPVDAKAGDARVPALIALACNRLAALTTSPCGGKAAWNPATSPASPADLQALQTLANASASLTQAIIDTAAARALVSDDLDTFKRRYPAETAPKCDASILPQIAKADADAVAAVAKAKATGAAADLAEAQRLSNLDFFLRTIVNDCNISTAAAKTEATARTRVTITPGQVSGVVADALAAAKAGAPEPPDPLQAKIDQITADAKRGDLKTLQDLESAIHEALADAPLAAQVAGLTKVQNDLTQMTAALACAGAATCQATLKGQYGEDASAALGMLNALGNAADVAAGRGAAANWLAAAQAIVAAEKTDAQLQLDAQKAAAAAADALYLARAREVSLLATTVLMATGQTPTAAPPPRPVNRIAPCAPADRFVCALPYFLASWNEGEAPAEVLDVRQIQAFRVASIQRQKAAAQAQRNVLLAATATLKGYGDGGVDPKVIAQFLSAFGIIAIAAK